MMPPEKISQLHRLSMSAQLHYYIAFSLLVELDLGKLSSRSKDDAHHKLIFLGSLESIAISVEMALKTLLVINEGSHPDIHNLNHLFSHIRKIGRGALSKKIAEKVGERFKGAGLPAPSVEEIASVLERHGDLYVKIKYMGLLKGGRISKKDSLLSGAAFLTLLYLYEVVWKMVETKLGRLGVPSLEKTLTESHMVITKGALIDYMPTLMEELMTKNRKDKNDQP